MITHANAVIQPSWFWNRNAEEYLNFFFIFYFFYVLRFNLEWSLNFIIDIFVYLRMVPTYPNGKKSKNMLTYLFEFSFLFVFFFFCIFFFLFLLFYKEDWCLLIGFSIDFNFFLISLMRWHILRMIDRFSS